VGNSGKPALIIFVCGILGLLIAAIEQLSYDNGYILNLYITEAAQLPGLQIVTIIVFLLLGAVLAAITS